MQDKAQKRVSADRRWRPNFTRSQCGHRFGIFELLLLVTLTLIFQGSGYAQTLYGTLTGTVTDPKGAIIQDAGTIALNTDTGIRQSAKTNGEGIYTFTDLPPGRYTVTVAATGFGALQVDQVEVKANTGNRLDFALKVARSETSTTITAATPELQTDRADVNFEISSKMLEDLPTTTSAGRNFQSLYSLVPGATPPVEQNSATSNPMRSQSTNVNGAPAGANATRLDGAIIAYPFLSYIIAYVPPQDAIASVNFSTNSFLAEQGSAGGAAVNVIIKSGTNKFHGSLWEYNSIKQFNAKTWNYQGTVLPKYISNEFGFAIGGPVLKDKLFFFGDFERFSQRKSLSGFQTIINKNGPLAQGNFTTTNTTIYDPKTGAADGTGRTAFAGDQIPVSPAAAALIALLPTPTNSGLQSNYYAVTNYQFDRIKSDVKVTYNPTSRSNLFARYSVSPYTISDPPALGAAGGASVDGGLPGTSNGRVQNVGLGATYAFTSNVLLDANGGYTRQYLSSAPNDIATNGGLDVLGIPGTNGPNPLQGGLPGFAFSTGYSTMGDSNYSTPALFRDNQYSGNVNFTYLHGKHNFRFGSEYIRSAINHFQPQGTSGPRGGFTFTGGLTTKKGGAAANLYNDLADFILGLPQTYGKTTAVDNPDALRFWSFASYAQDQWQVMQKVTLTYGVRYEIYPFATRDHSGSYRFDPTSGNVLLGGIGATPYNTGEEIGYGKFVPRLGVAYRVTAQTVVRAGYGMTVDPENYRSLAGVYPAVIAQQFNGANSFSAAGCLNAGSHAPLGGCPQAGIPTIALPNKSSGAIPLPSTVATNTIIQNFRRPYLNTWNLAIQQDFGRGVIFNAGYVGLNEVRATAQLNINTAPINGVPYALPGGGTGLHTGTAARPLNIAYGITTDVISDTPWNSINYNGLQTQLSDRSNPNSQFGIVYTWSHALNFIDNGTLGTSPQFGDPLYYKRNYANASYDRTNNFQVWGIYKFPFGKGQKFLQHGIGSWLAGGWQVNGTLSKVSGTPFTVIQSSTNLNAPGAGGQTADQLAPRPTVYGVHSPGHLYIHSNDFALVPTTLAPPNIRYGTGGRNNVRGPGINQLNASLFRSFPVRAWGTFQFRAEAFDATNTPQFPNPSASLSTLASFGLVNTANVNRTMLLSGRIIF